MNSANHTPSLAEDLLRLYELALSVGQTPRSLDTPLHFIKILVERYNLTGASVWWRSDSNSMFQPLSGLPKKLLRDTSGVDTATVSGFFHADKPTHYRPETDDHKQLDRFFEVTNQHLVIYPFSGNGILIMRAALEEVFTTRMLNGLRPVVENLGNAIDGWQAHLQLKRSEQALNHQSGFLKTLIQTLPDLIWLKDPEGVFLACNSRFEEFFGVPEEQILGKTDYDFVDADLADFFRNNDRKAIEKGAPSSNEEWITFANNGHRELLETIKTPMFDATGELIGVLGIGRNITERREAENRSRRFRERLDMAIDAIAVIDPESGRFLDVNQSCCDFFGVDRETMLQRHTYDFSELMDYPQRWQETVDHLRQYGKMTMEDRGIKEEGSPYVVEVKAQYAKDQDEEYVVAIIRDIAERKQAEKALQESEQRFRTAGRAAYDLIYEWDVAKDSLRWFGDVDSMLGFQPGQISSNTKAWLNLIHPEDIQKLKDTVELYRTATDPISYEYRIRHNSGGYRYWSDHGLPLLDEQCKPYLWIGVCKDITVEKEHQHQLEYIAHYDTLTGLPNRVLLIDRLQQAMAQGKRREHQLVVAYLDLDGFKEINDSYGHNVGDRFLAAIGVRMKQALRECDTIARLGGDEFVAVLQDVGDKSDYLPLLRRLLNACAIPINIDGLNLQASASLGATVYPQAVEVDADLLLRQSDQAMYQAKLAGRNRYHLFDTEHDRSLPGRHANLERISDALANREFLLHYQPKVNMRTGEVIGAEALLRWQHQEKGLLLPSFFLPAIEDQPLAEEMGEWVIDTVLEQMGLWRAQGLDLPVSVNVGARQLQHPGFVTNLSKLLAAHPSVPAGWLEFEILETCAMEDLFKVSRVMYTCIGMGVSFALDDFGTGYSPLTYLKHLPASSIKIDRTFVRDMLDDSEDLAILEGVMGMSAAFRRQVIAEGVETREHGDLLLQLGCNLAQGYGIAKPMPADQIPDWVSNWRPFTSWSKQQRINRDDLALLFAGIEHRAWIRRLEDYLTDKSNHPPPLLHTDCRFGLWLKEEGNARYGTKDAYKSIVSLHKQVHLLGKELCEMRRKGYIEKALSGLGSVYELRDVLLELLNESLMVHEAKSDTAVS